MTGEGILKERIRDLLHKDGKQLKWLTEDAIYVLYVSLLDYIREAKEDFPTTIKVKDTIPDYARDTFGGFLSFVINSMEDWFHKWFGDGEESTKEVKENNGNMCTF